MTEINPKDLQDAFSKMIQKPMGPTKYSLIHGFNAWSRFIEAGVTRMKMEDLIKARDSKELFIAKVEGVDCYLTPSEITR